MTPFLLANFVDASNKKLYKRRIYIDLGIKDFDSSLCWIMQHYPVKFDVMHGFECQTDLTNVAALKDPIDSCISGTAAEKMGYTTEGMMDMLHIYHNFIGLDEDSSTSPQMLGLLQANAVASREFGRVTFPDGKSAIEAAATLANERLVAEFSKCFWVHGNSLGLTSKSPLTCTRMAGAVVQRIGGAWA